MTNPSTICPLDIAIIGGGIAGLTLAIGLLKQNIQMTLYESAYHFGEIGAGVAFGPNATRAMNLIDPSIKHAFDKVASRNQWGSQRHSWFELRFGQVEGSKGKPFNLVHQLNAPEGLATAHRADFLDEVVKLVPENIVRFGKRVLSLNDTGERGVHLIFRDGTEAKHAAVIGCDGLKSETRKYILSHGNPAASAVFSGKYCNRGLIPLDQAAEVLGDELARNNQMYLGHHKHILTFPVQKGKTMNGKHLLDYLQGSRLGCGGCSMTF